jgi:hypothetical protein
MMFSSNGLQMGGKLADGLREVELGSLGSQAVEQGGKTYWHLKTMCGILVV